MSKLENLRLLFPTGKALSTSNTKWHRPAPNHRSHRQKDCIKREDEESVGERDRERERDTEICICGSALSLEREREREMLKGSSNAAENLQTLTQCKRLLAPSKHLLSRHRTAVVSCCSATSKGAVLGISATPESICSGAASGSLADRLRLGRLTEDGLSYKEKFIVRCYEVGINKTATVETIANLLQVLQICLVSLARSLSQISFYSGSLCSFIGLLFGPLVLIYFYVFVKLSHCMPAIVAEFSNPLIICSGRMLL